MQISALVSSSSEPVNSQIQAGKLERAAVDFESLLVAQMLKSARESAESTCGAAKEDDSGSSLMDMAEQQFAQSLAAAGGLGIGKMVIAGLTKHADR
jgi:Rod binding domain-containing protein